MTNYFKILDFTLKGLLVTYSAYILLMLFNILINNFRSLNLLFAIKFMAMDFFFALT